MTKQNEELKRADIKLVPKGAESIIRSLYPYGVNEISSARRVGRRQIKWPMYHDTSVSAQHQRVSFVCHALGVLQDTKPLPAFKLFLQDLERESPGEVKELFSHEIPLILVK